MGGIVYEMRTPARTSGMLLSAGREIEAGLGETDSASAVAAEGDDGFDFLRLASGAQLAPLPRTLCPATAVPLG